MLEARAVRVAVALCGSGVAPGEPPSEQANTTADENRKIVARRLNIIRVKVGLPNRGYVSDGRFDQRGYCGASD